MQQWLEAKGVGSKHSIKSVPVLFKNDYTKSSLEDVTQAELVELGLSIPIARSLSKFLKIKEEQGERILAI